MYGSDDVFAGTGADAAWRLHLPAWQSVLASAVDLGGQAEPINGLRMIGAGMLLLYLLLLEPTIPDAIEAAIAARKARKTPPTR